MSRLTLITAFLVFSICPGVTVAQQLCLSTASENQECSSEPIVCLAIKSENELRYAPNIAKLCEHTVDLELTKSFLNERIDFLGNALEAMYAEASVSEVRYQKLRKRYRRLRNFQKTHRKGRGS